VKNDDRSYEDAVVTIETPKQIKKSYNIIDVTPV